MTLETKQVPLTRANAITWAREIVADPNAVYLDTETTGLGRFAKICDIAIVAQDGTVLLDTMINPGEPIPAAASNVHGITDEMVADAPTWRDVAADIACLLENRRVVIYNRGYDAELLEQHNKEIDWHPFNADYQCAMLAFSDFDGTMGNYRTLKWHKLDVAAAHFGIAPGGHRALADTETTRQVVHAMAAEGGPLTADAQLTIDPESTIGDAELTPEAIDPVISMAADEDPPATAEPEPDSPERRPSIEDLFILLKVETDKRNKADAKIADLRGRVHEWMISGGLQSTVSETTPLVARIDKVTKLVVTDSDQLLEWAKSHPVGQLYLTESVDTKMLTDSVRKGLSAPGVELTTDERLVIAPKKSAS